MPSLIDNPQYWRDRAEETRAKLDDMADAKSRQIMRDIAAGYDRLAEHAAKREKASKKKH